MKVQELQQFLRSLAQPLETAGGKRIADDLVRAADGLEPFKERTINDFCNFLSRVGEHYNQHGDFPAGGRRASTPKPGSEERVKEAAQRVMGLYERGADADLPAEMLDQEMQQLGELTLPELKQVARELDLMRSYRTKQEALDDIQTKLRAGRGMMVANEQPREMSEDAFNREQEASTSASAQ